MNARASAAVIVLWWAACTIAAFLVSGVWFAVAAWVLLPAGVISGAVLAEWVAQRRARRILDEISRIGEDGARG